MHKLSRETCRETVELVQKKLDAGFSLTTRPSAIRAVANELKVNPSNVYARYQAAWRLYKLKATEKKQPKKAAPPVEAMASDLPDKVRNLIILKPRTPAELASKLSATVDQILEAVGAIALAGTNVQQIGGKIEVIKHHLPAYVDTPAVAFTSDEDNQFRFGVVGDNHCGSKYERRDVLADLYDRFEAAGIKNVLHTGNWIDGEARFNKHDLVAHGAEQQCQLLAETYPKRKGITTYAVYGDDHEGWYEQREGINIGTYAENVFKRAGREDWVNVGFMEAHASLINYKTGATATLALVHPGGGSSYALSYAVQKIVESLEGGEKPAVGIYGHLHKLWSGNIRNVWCLISGCTQDQTPFMRKNKLEAHVAGTLLTLEQDPSSGAIIGFCPDMKRYFVRGYYGNRWSHHSDVVKPERSIGGI